MKKKFKSKQSHNNKNEKTNIKGVFVKKTRDEQLAEKIARIQSLELSRKNLVRLVNRPISMVVSIILFPSMINFLFLKENSPFRWLYEEFYRYLYQQIYLHPDMKKFDSFVTIDSDLEKNFNSFVMTMETIGDAILTKMSSGVKPNFEEIVNFYEKRRDLFKDNESLFNVKVYLINLFNYYIISYPSESNPNLISMEAINDHTLYELFMFVQGRIDASKTHIARALMPNYRNYVTGAIVKDNVNVAVFVSKLIFTISAQYLIVDPLIEKFFPYGVFNKKPPSSEAWLTLEQATLLVDELEEYDRSLTKRANFSKYWAKIASFFIVLLSSYMILQENNPSPEFIVFVLTLFTTAFHNFGKDFASYRRTETTKSHLKEQRKFLDKALKNFDFECEEFFSSELDSSYLTIRFASIDYNNNQALSGKIVATLFKNCCEKNNISVAMHRGNFIELSAVNMLNAKNSDLLNDLFSKSISQEINERIFSTQLRSLLNIILLNNYRLTKLPGVDKKGVPITIFSIHYSKSLEKSILAKFLELFENSVVSSQKLNEYSEITIVGAKPFESMIYKKVSTELSYLVDSIKVRVFKLDEGENQPIIVKNKNNNNEAEEVGVEVENIDVDLKELKTFKHRVLQWSKATYDSHKPNTKVYPIIFGKEHNKEAYERARFFITNRLNYDKVLDELDESVREDVENKINELVPKIKFKSKQGQQGLVPWVSVEFDQDGKKFKTVAKGKILGKFGKIRFFLSSEILPTGENLLSIEGVDLSHCARIKTK